MSYERMIEVLRRKTTIPEDGETFEEIYDIFMGIACRLEKLGADRRVIEVIERVSSIPEDGETFEEISEMYDKAIELLERDKNNE